MPAFAYRTHLVALVAVVALLAGCAGNVAFRESQALAAQGRPEESLSMLRQALQEDPTNAEIRSAYLVTRDRLLQDWLLQAEAAQADGKAAEADALYRRILGLDSNHSRARAGIESLARQRRHGEWLKEAEAAWAKKDSETAAMRLRQILAENPRHTAARALQDAIEAKTARPATESRASAALRKPISIEYRDAPIKQVFEVFARVTGLNFVFDKDVRPDLRATVYLRNTTVQDAMNLILMTNQLESRIMDSGSVVIYPNTPAKARDYQQLVVKTFFLANADVKQVANTIKTIIKTRDLVIDEKQNMLIMRDSPDAVRLAEKLLALHDLPDPEVMLEVEILEVKRTSLLQLGIQWPDQLSLVPLAGASGKITLTDIKNLNSDRLEAALSPLIINLKKVDGDSNLLANPRIRVRNREKAKVLIGSRVPTFTTTLTATGFSSESAQYQDVGLKLEVEPTIYLDNEVAIKVSLEVSNIINQVLTKSGSTAYEIGTRNTATVLRLRDNENQVLAGLINDEDRRSANKVPGLGDIPLLGRLFSSHSNDEQKTEIILSITPRLIRNIARPDLSKSEFDSGTEASVRSRAADGGAALMLPQPASAVGVQTMPAVPAPMPVSPGSIASPAAADSGASAAPVIDAGQNLGVAAAQWVGTGTARAGEVISVQLDFSSAQPVASVPINLSFDPKAVEVVSVQEGDFLRQGGAAATMSSQIDKDNGVISVRDVRSGPGGASGSGTLLNVILRALTPSTSSLSVVFPPLTTATGSAIHVNTPPPMEIVVK